MKIEFIEPAQAELDEAFLWYEEQRQGLGYEFLDEFEESLQRLSSHPEAYAPIEFDVRRCLLKRFPYGVIFGLDQQNDMIVIVAVSHLHKEPLYWRKRVVSIDINGID